MAGQSWLFIVKPVKSLTCILDKMNNEIEGKDTNFCLVTKLFNYLNVIIGKW